MTRIFERTGFLLLLAAVFALSTFPARAGAPETTEIQRIESYLNALHTLEARFVQNNPDGSYALGKLYLKRPGQLRFEYDPPIPLRLYA
ncbi:MAG: outer membrane lipoprotein carrier protein LolA, partial [Rickettsiales bacterium]